MSPITHFLTGWVFANCTRLEKRDRGLVTLACVVPDLDGLGIVPELITRNSDHPLLWFSQYHHSLHSLSFAIAISIITFALASQKWKTACLSFFSFHLHLVEDLLGSRGPDGYPWPIPYFKPFSNAFNLTWSRQWALNAWPNVLLTIVLLAITLRFAWVRGFSPLEMISAKLDSEFVAALRNRFHSEV